MCDNNFKEDPIEIPEKDTNKEQGSTQKKPEEKKEYDKDDWKKMFSKKLYDLIGEESVSSIANKIDIEARTLHNYIKEKAVPTAMNLAKILLPPRRMRSDLLRNCILTVKVCLRLPL